MTHSENMEALCLFPDTLPYASLPSDGSRGISSCKNKEEQIELWVFLLEALMAFEEWRSFEVRSCPSLCKMLAILLPSHCQVPPPTTVSAIMAHRHFQMPLEVITTLGENHWTYLKSGSGSGRVLENAEENKVGLRRLPENSSTLIHFTLLRFFFLEDTYS